PSATSTGVSTQSRGVAAPDPGGELLLLRMLRAMEKGYSDEVLSLADQHPQQYPGYHLEEREELRIRALVQLGRLPAAEAVARAQVARRPESRRSMERALGHALGPAQAPAQP